MTADGTDNKNTISSSNSIWSREENKAFENALAIYPEDSSDRWDNIAEDIPGKSLEEIKHHYELLLDDVNRIESGCVPLPCYYSPSLNNGDEDGTSSKKGAHLNSDSNHGGKASKSDQERRKGIAWTEEEHRLFLLGLDKYGKGDWRSISRNFVVTRTPTQVASHAQKYFIRLNSINKERRRSSIHDITSVNGGDVSGPITGQANSSATTASSKSNKPSPQTAATNSGVGMYGAPTIGQPVGGPIVSAVGTPVNVNLPPPPAHMVYGVRAPPVPGAPVNMGPPPMAYPVPMPHTLAHAHR